VQVSANRAESLPSREIMRRSPLCLTWKGLGGIRLPISAVKMEIPTQKSSRENKFRRQGRVTATNGPSRSAELPNEPRLLPNRGQGDMRLTGDGGLRRIRREK